jgi:O-antigen ligase
MRVLARVPETPLAVSGAALVSAVTAFALVRIGPAAAVALAFLPLLAIGVVYVITTGQTVIYAAALALPMVPIAVLGSQLGGLLYVQDLIAVVALGALVLATFVARGRVPPVPMTPVLGWPFVLFAVAIMAATLRGHYAYGASLIGQPLRLFLYAAVVAGLIGMTVPRLHRLLTGWFYVGGALVALWALYYIATGGSATDQSGLSTGGTRPLAISPSMYAAGTFFLALLNLRLASESRRRSLHLTFAAIGLFGAVVGFGRAVYLGVFVVGLLLFVVSRRLRNSTLSFVPLALPFVVLIAIGASHAAPELVDSIGRRVTAGSSASDVNVQWRVKANSAVLEQVREQPLVGVGFGRSAEVVIESRDEFGLPYEQRVEVGQDPHNGYMFLLAGGGAVALASFVLLLGVFAVDAIRRFRRTLDPTARLLIIWAAATLFVFLLNIGAGLTLANPADVMAIWALLVLPAVVGGQGGSDPIPKPATLKPTPLRIR